MKLIKFTIVFMLLLTVSASAQEIYGTWQNSQYNATMILERDGTYAFTGPYGVSTGRWGVQNQQFWMQGQSGQVLYYMITGYSATNFNLADANGVPLYYTRNASAADATITVLADCNGKQLTSDHINTGVGIIQFIIGQSIKESEIAELRQASIEEFPSGPDEWLRQIASLKQSLQQLHQLQDPLQIGAARQMLFSEFYKATINMTQSDIPLLIRVIYRYVKVLAWDQTNSLVLTDRDADGMIEYIEFSNQLYGINTKFSSAERQKYKNDLAHQFILIPLDQRQFLCSASLALLVLKANWQQFSVSQQEQFQDSYVNNQTDQYGLAQVEGYPYNGTRAEKRAALSRMRRENMANQNMFNMMNNMNLSTHATMLNTIENYGGTGRYWEVVDY
ncbi:hypothetical protein KAR48_18480 [bacterium]|nr:hypothetical protein [bacterium]